MGESDDFALLRELLANPIQDDEWNATFCVLVEEVFEQREGHRKLWMSYCEQHATLLTKPIKQLDSVDELVRWSNICPFAFFSLDLSF